MLWKSSPGVQTRSGCDKIKEQDIAKLPQTIYFCRRSCYATNAMKFKRPHVENIRFPH